jgi:hypothetical protein
MVLELVVRRFGIGALAAEPVRVAGGLSNELWRVTTSEGVFAVKRMVVAADRPDFVGNVEAAFAVERRAWDAGVPMPQPVATLGGGRALASVGGSLYRVHHWVEGVAGAGSAVAAADLLATIHAAGNPRRAAADIGWVADRWGAELVSLTRRVHRRGLDLVVVDSHRDLDRKNALLAADGVLMALDWDAAGPTAAVHEAVGLALDWSVTADDFGQTIDAYVARSRLPVPAQPWIFGGWVAAQGAWLDHNAAQRAGSPLGQAEIAGTLARLHTLAADLDTLLDALGP